MLLNRERALELMQKFSLDALVAATRENVIYMSDFAPWGQAVHKYFQRPCFVIFPRRSDQSTALLIYPGEATYVAAQKPWIDEVCTYGAPRAVRLAPESSPTEEEQRFAAVFDAAKHRGKEPAEALTRVLREKGLASGVIALDHEGMAQEIKGALRAALPNAKFHDASDLFRLIRMIKSDDEIARLKRACELNEAAVRAMFQSAAVGRTELELCGEFYKHIGAARGIVGWQHLGSGRRSEGIFPASAKKLERGDLLRTDVGVYFDAYHSDVCATGVLGEPTVKQAQLFFAGMKGIEACLERVKPGALPSEILDGLNRGIKQAGVNQHKDFVGHTIGIEAREFPFEFATPKQLSSPFLPETTDVPLEEKMMINVEVALVELGFGGIQIEHTLLVRKNGFDFITAEKRELTAV
jgi:Xaa-Pro dipeptidase